MSTLRSRLVAVAMRFTLLVFTPIVLAGLPDVGPPPGVVQARLLVLPVL